MTKIRGLGYLLSFHYSPNAIRGALEDLKNFVLEKEYHIYETVKLKKIMRMNQNILAILVMKLLEIKQISLSQWEKENIVLHL